MRGEGRGGEGLDEQLILAFSFREFQSPGDSDIGVCKSTTVAREKHNISTYSFKLCGARYLEFLTSLAV